MVEDLIAEARTYIDVPWQHQGRSRRGVDCVGYLILALRKFGIHIDEIKGYARKPNGKQLKNIMDNQPNLTAVQPPYLPGDIPLFRLRHEPQHVALLTGRPDNLYMIHAFNGGQQKKVVEHIFADYWRQKVVCVYRLNSEL